MWSPSDSSRGRSPRRVRGICFFLAWALLGCGARSGLIAPPLDVIELDVADESRTVPGTQPPIDPSCPGTCPFRDLTSVFPAFRPLLPPDVPADCANGFELGGATGGCGRATYTLNTTRATGSRAITLDVDLATYHAPDGITITGIDSNGRRYTLLQSCRMQTSLLSGPSTERPSDDTIRQFRIDVREGTTQLDFDFGAVTSPMYIKVLGLCDFNVSRFAAAAFWRAIP